MSRVSVVKGAARFATQGGSPVARYSTRACASGNAKARPPLSYRWGGGLLAGGGGAYMLSPDGARTSSSESKVDGSSTLLRPASPAAPRRQTVTLVFLTSQATTSGLMQSVVSNFSSSNTGRDRWYSWIGYFREAGYDCLQMNLALPNANKEAGGDVTLTLSDELHEQIRLSNLQRLPVLFVHHGSGANPDETAEIVSKYIEPSSGSNSGGGIWASIFGGGGMFGSKPAISGLIVLSDLDSATARAKFAKHPKLNTLIVAHGTAPDDKKVQIMDCSNKSYEETVKDVERWLIRRGYEG